MFAGTRKSPGFSRASRQSSASWIFSYTTRDRIFLAFTPLNLTLEQWDTALDSQAKAFLVGVREASKLMPNGGRILAITYAPGARFGSWQPWVAMGSAKAAMESLCRYFAVALARRRITVNAISPGWIEDSVLNTLPESVQQRIREWNQGGWIPMGHLGTPADIGNAVALLCSEEAGWITGQTLAVDGGASLMETIMPLDIQQAVPDASAA
jgi:enoyl-[acyl-carrier protein] reductase III